MRRTRLIVLFSVFTALTLLIVLSSVVFSVQHIDAYCYNVENPTTMEEVLQNHNIKKNKNIFTLNKGVVTKDVEKNVPNIKVINIEKRFPNRVTINYVEISEYIKIFQEGKTYFCANDGKILRIEDGLSADQNTIEVTLKGTITNTEPGEKLNSSSSNDGALIESILSSLERLSYRKDVVDLLRKIDVTNPASIMITTATGMRWKLIGGEHMLEKLQLALSTYLSDQLSVEQKRDGMLILSGFPVKCQYQAPA